MLRNLGIAALFVTAVAAQPAAPLAELGTAFCFGVQCPCGNDDPTAGCANSTGQGARLTAGGSTSIAAGDISFTADHMATNAVALLAFSRNTRNIPFKDGRLCIGPDVSRFWKHLNSGQQGSVTYNQVISGLALTETALAAGETWHAQVWYRDPAQGGACGNKANTTNGYTVTFTP